MQEYCDPKPSQSHTQGLLQRKNIARAKQDTAPLGTISNSSRVIVPIASLTTAARVLPPLLVLHKSQETQGAHSQQEHAHNPHTGTPSPNNLLALRLRALCPVVEIAREEFRRGLGGAVETICECLRLRCLSCLAQIGEAAALEIRDG